MFQGAVAEQFAGQEILVSQKNHRRVELYYWVREAKNSNAEIDYMIELNAKVIPIEVKFGASGRLKSMHLFLEKYHSKKGLKISQAPYKNEDKIVSLPFYGIECYLNSTGKDF